MFLRRNGLKIRRESCRLKPEHSASIIPCSFQCAWADTLVEQEWGSDLLSIGGGGVHTLHTDSTQVLRNRTASRGNIVCVYRAATRQPERLVSATESELCRNAPLLLPLCTRASVWYQLNATDYTSKGLF